MSPSNQDKNISMSFVDTKTKSKIKRLSKKDKRKRLIERNNRDKISKDLEETAMNESEKLNEGEQIDKKENIKFDKIGSEKKKYFDNENGLKEYIHQEEKADAISDTENLVKKPFSEEPNVSQEVLKENDDGTLETNEKEKEILLIDKKLNNLNLAKKNMNKPNIITTGRFDLSILSLKENITTSDKTSSLENKMIIEKFMSDQIESDTHREPRINNRIFDQVKSGEKKQILENILDYKNLDGYNSSTEESFGVKKKLGNNNSSPSLLDYLKDPNIHRNQTNCQVNIVNIPEEEKINISLFPSKIKRNKNKRKLDEHDENQKITVYNCKKIEEDEESKALNSFKNGITIHNFHSTVDVRYVEKEDIDNRPFYKRFFSRFLNKK